MGTFRIDEPMWLALALAAAPLGLMGWRAFRAMSTLRRVVSILWRTAFLTALALAIAGSSRVREVDRVAVIGVVDVSGSVRELFDAGKDGMGKPRGVLAACVEHLNRSTKGRKADDLSGLVVFDRAAAAVVPLERRATGEAGREAGAFLDVGLIKDLAPAPNWRGGVGGATDIAAALRLAAAMAPPDAVTRVVLFSDGRQTRGDAVKAAGELTRLTPSATGAAVDSAGDSGAIVNMRRAGIPVDVVALNYRVNNEVSVESVEAPGLAPGESTVQVRVTMNTLTPVSGLLGLTRDGVPLDVNGAEAGLTRPITLPAGRTTVNLPVRLPADRVHEFEATFAPDPGLDGIATDRISENNRARAVTLSPGKGSVLVVDGVSDGRENGAGAQLSAALVSGGLSVKTVAPSMVSADPLYFQRYDLVVLENVPVDALAEGTPAALASYVSDLGGGLVMVGGDASFGAGGWKGTAVEPILPVLLDLPERLVTPGTAVMIVMDVSGSMNFRVTGAGGGSLGRSQIEIAREGAVAAVEALDKTDMVGMITFHNEYDTVVPLAPNKNAARTAARIREIRAEGGTNLPPALEAAGSALAGVKAEIRHIIVLSDGRSQGTERLPGLAEELHGRGIRISTIAVGDGADTASLAKLAEVGGGTFYRVTDPNLLPRLFVKAVRVVRTPLIRERPFRPLVLATGSPLVEGLSAGEMPPLHGLVLTQARRDKTVVYAMAAPVMRETEGGEPVLAHWNAGLGRVAAFTSDASRWAEEWIGWPGYTRMWLQVAREISRPQVERGQELVVEVEDSTLRVEFIARDAEGKPVDLLEVEGMVFAPSGVDGVSVGAGASPSEKSRRAAGRIPVRLAQTGPGEYRASVPADEEGTYIVTLVPRTTTAGGGPRKALPPAVGAVVRSGGGGEEFRNLTGDPAVLEQVARLTGGRVRRLDDPSPPDLYDRSGLEPAIARSPLWRALMMAGIAIFVVDVGSRRVAWDRWVGSEFGASMRRRARAAVRDRSEQAARAIGELRRKEREFEVRAEASTRASADTAKPLGAEDARELARTEMERRRRLRDEARAAARRAAGEQAVGSAEPADKPAEVEEKRGGQEDEQGGLLAAKRRARKKMEE